MQIINDGYLGDGRTDEDYIAGTLPYEVRVPSGDWRPFVPNGEKQFNYKADSMSCVSFSAINVIETQEFFLTGKRINYSDRWIAKMSNTRPTGNTLRAVVEAIRTYGLVLETDYPTPPEPWTWEQYHAEIPEPLKSQLLAKGKKWLETHTVNYEWVDLFFNQQELHKQLQHTPIQMVFPNHAVEGTKEDVIYFDTYEPWLKQKAKSQFTSALKILLTVKNMNQTKVVLSKDGKTVYQCTPVATTFEEWKKQASVEGIAVPTPIPPSSSL